MSEKVEKKMPKQLNPKDVDVFKTLYLNCYKPLCVRAFLILKDQESAEDVVQDLFVKLWQSRAFVQHIQQPEAYLNQAVKNACFDHLKKNNRMQLATQLETSMASPDLLDTIITNESMENLDAAMSALPAQCKRIFDLVYLQNKKYQETADMMGVSINTVKTQLKRGLAKLKKNMKQFK